MYKYVNAFTNRSGDSLPGYFARLYDSTGTEVDIYADNNGTPISTVSGVANAALSDENGMFRWYVENGIYDIKFYDANDTFVTSEAGVPMYDSGAVLDDLASETGGELVGIGQTTISVIARVTPQQFGAAGDGVANDTSSIQEAIDTGAREIFFPAGTYIHGNLTLDNDYQRLVGPGARLQRNSGAATITVSGRGVQCRSIQFSGGSNSGNNITVTGPEATFSDCDSIETSGRALLADSDGGNLEIRGGVWNTTNASGTGYDIELHDDTPGTSLYSRLIGISTNQTTGGVLLDGQGTVRIIGCQIGKLTIQNSSGGMYDGNRFNGAVSVQASTNQFSNNAFASTVTFGDGSGGNIGQIAFDSTNIMQASGTLTINSDVIESTFHLGQVQAAGATVVLNGPNNDIWHSEISYTPTLSAGGGSPTVGDGTLTGKYSRQGRQWTANVSFSFGSTSSFGSGDVTITAPFKAKSKAVGNVRITDAGTGHFTGVCEIAANAQTVVFYAGAGSSPVGTPVRAAVPMTWANGDSMSFTISGEYVA